MNFLNLKNVGYLVIAGFTAWAVSSVYHSVKQSGADEAKILYESKIQSYDKKIIDFKNDLNIAQNQIADLMLKKKEEQKSKLGKISVESQSYTRVLNCTPIVESQMILKSETELKSAREPFVEFNSDFVSKWNEISRTSD